MKSAAPLQAPTAAAVDWKDRGWAWRDRLLASPLFRRAAAAFWPTRPIARRRARELFDLVAGFVYSQVLLACVRLDLFERLFDAPRTAAELAPLCALPEPAMQRLLDAAVALRLLQPRRHGRYGLGPLGAPMVGNRAIAAMVEHHAALYADLRDPLALLRGTPTSTEKESQLAQYWPYATAADPASLAQARVDAYCALMSASQPLVADEILDAYPMRRHRRVLDVGGGDGTFLCAAAGRAPALQLVLFDLPAVAARAQSRFVAHGLAGRASVVGGDFLRDPLPQGADLATLVRVIHDHDDPHALVILQAVHAALPPAGRVLLAEPMAQTPGAQAMGDAYFGLYLLAMGQGKPRSAAALQALLERAGFTQVRALRTTMPLQTGVLLATRTPV